MYSIEEKENMAQEFFVKNKQSFIELIYENKIIYEFELGLSSVLIECCTPIFTKLINLEGVDINLSSTCYEHKGDTLYSLFDDEMGLDVALKLTKNKYWKDYNSSFYN